MSRFATFFVPVVLAGCGGMTATPPSVAPATYERQRAVEPSVCDKAEHVEIKPVGGSFKVPACSAWGGTITYPRLLTFSHFDWHVRSSVTNDFGAPAPPSGTAVFYMQTSNIGLRTPEFENTGAIDVVSNPELLPKHFYSLVVYNFERDNQCRRPPPSGCPPWFVNIGHPSPGTHRLTFSSPLNGAAFNPSKDVVWQFIQLY